MTNTGNRFPGSDLIESKQDGVLQIDENYSFIPNSSLPHGMSIDFCGAERDEDIERELKQNGFSQGKLIGQKKMCEHDMDMYVFTFKIVFDNKEVRVNIAVKQSGFNEQEEFIKKVEEQVVNTLAQ